MRPIRRAAVTGLFALWLAPLAAQPPAPARESATRPEARSTLPLDGAPDPRPAREETADLAR
jgi:hypothetical protein